MYDMISLILQDRDGDADGILGAGVTYEKTWEVGNSCCQVGSRRRVFVSPS